MTLVKSPKSHVDSRFNILLYIVWQGREEVYSRDSFYVIDGVDVG